jgi:hypothetical protein
MASLSLDDMASGSMTFEDSLDFGADTQGSQYGYRDFSIASQSQGAHGGATASVGATADATHADDLPSQPCAFLRATVSRIECNFCRQGSSGPS